MPIIVAEGLSKQFPNEQRPAVDGASFSVEPGELIVLLGPSGCGKTTLLKLLNRLYEPTGGRLLIDGEDARSLPATELRRRIGYAIQQTGLFPHLRIAQNIAVVPRLLGWDRPRIEARVAELLDLVGLPQTYAARYPRQLSGGEQQRVGLARALAADPAIMLMDEPFGALDAITRTRLQDELRAIQRKLAKTIIFVTHDVEEALRLADRIIVMRAGKIVQMDTPLAIVTRPGDAFVAQLLGTDDLLRQLSLLTVADALGHRPPPGDTAPEGEPAWLKPEDDLRTALAELLRAGAESLPVCADGRELGRLSVSDLRAMLPRAEPSQAVGAVSGPLPKG
jgi:osmoprotectant transport system ATP-binding protein